MNLVKQLRQLELQHATRRHFLAGGMAGLGALWLGSRAVANTPAPTIDPANPFRARPAQFAPRAKNVIFLHMAGAPSQFELFDHKPDLDRLNGQDCPESFLSGMRFAFIRGVPKLLGSTYPFMKAGESGLWISDRLPHLAKVIDKLCFVRTMRTDQFNHAPAELLLHTGNANLGYPTLGAWAMYGLGSENENLPGYMVLISGGRFPSAGKSAWGAGYLPGVYQGVQCRSQGDPVLYLNNPPGIDRDLREKMVQTISEVNRTTHEQLSDPETLTRVSQYELAFRMQVAATDALDIKTESAETHAAYATEPGRESFANNCLLARRLVERGVRFVQLFDWGWDSHGAGADEALNGGFKSKCRQIDQPISALLSDLDQRGLLDETLVVFAGEFGRTPMRENRGGTEMALVGRDHHPHAFTIWLAGGGVKGGFSYGETDPIGFAAVTPAVEVRDLHATLLHLLGIEHRQLTYPYLGLDQKLTGVKPCRVVSELFA